jgi:hypothetical protein
MVPIAIDGTRTIAQMATTKRQYWTYGAVRNGATSVNSVLVARNRSIGKVFIGKERRPAC